MAKTEQYDRLAGEYDDWFSHNKDIYESELEAVRKMVPRGGIGVEIGVGTGRFAGPLGIGLGVEPSRSMRAVAAKRGISVISGVAEALPLKQDTFDFVLMVTVLCFLDDVDGSLREFYRILKPSGSAVIGFIDRETPVGRTYQERKGDSQYYRNAEFFSAREVSGFLEAAGFHSFEYYQTVFQTQGAGGDIQPVREGFGDGCFVVVKATK